MSFPAVSCGQCGEVLAWRDFQGQIINFNHKRVHRTIEGKVHVHDDSAEPSVLIHECEGPQLFFSSYNIIIHDQKKETW